MIFYPVYNQLAFADVSLAMNPANEFLWTFDYGFRHYDHGWREASGYISDSIGTGAMMFVLGAGVWAVYRNYRSKRDAL